MLFPIIIIVVSIIIIALWARNSECDHRRMPQNPKWHMNYDNLYR